MGPGQHGDRQDQMHPASIDPAASREPAEIDAKPQLQQGRHQEVGDDDADHDHQHQHIVRPFVLVDRSQHAGQDADGRRDHEGGQGQGQGEGETDGDEPADRKALDHHGRAEVALQQAPDIDEILIDQRLIEIVVRAQIGQHVGRERALTVKGATGRQAQNEKTDCNGDQCNRNGRKHAPKSV